MRKYLWSAVLALGISTTIAVCLLNRKSDAQIDSEAVERILQKAADAHSRKSWDPELAALLLARGKGILPQVEYALEDYRAGVPELATDVLAQTPEVEIAVSAFLRRLDRPYALGALEGISRRKEGAEELKKQLPRIHAFLQAGPSFNAYFAARIVGRCGGPDSRTLLARLREESRRDLSHPLFKMCDEACSLSAARLGDPASLEALHDELTSPDARTRFDAFRKAAFVGTPGLVPWIAPLLEDRRYPSSTGEATEGDLDYSIRVCDAAACALAILAPQSFFTPPGTRGDLPLRDVTDDELNRWKAWWLAHKSDLIYK